MAFVKYVMVQKVLNALYVKINMFYIRILVLQIALLITLNRANLVNNVILLVKLALEIRHKNVIHANIIIAYNSPVPARVIAIQNMVCLFKIEVEQSII